MVTRLKKPWLLLPASLSHKIGPALLRIWSFFKSHPKNTNNKIQITKIGLTFSSPFGTAGGLDKAAKDLNTWTKWNAGFLEIGTFTPKPQGPNPGKIMGRNAKHQALWNCMGFPNAGFEAVLPKIKKYKRSQKNAVPLFVNIGKNRDTPMSHAHDDYVAGIHFFKDVADCFVLNISSPNTKDLRLLHQKENFQLFINPIIEATESLDRRVPLLIKLSPDLDDASFSQFIKNCTQLNIDGFILTNTTTARPDGIDFPERGGLSGKPLAQTSKAKLKLAKQALGGDQSKLLISVGGVCSPEDAIERIEMGADLVQIYSGLIFYGPSLFQDSKKLYEAKK